MVKSLNILTLLIFSLILNSGYSQTANSLMQLHKLADESAMNAIVSPNEGSIVYNENNKRVYFYDGSAWTKLSIAPVINNQTNNNYTLLASDDGDVITFDGTSNVTLTIPSGLSTGFNVSVYQKDNGNINDGSVTITAGTGVTIINRLDRYITAGDGAGIGIIALEDDVFYITGDLKKM